MAKVLTGISGNVISAASAGFAPTNSADVSAIASAYQVVSATATQLYAGTAYVTSVNDAPLSASRAGNAANASLATSAYYDGTGRLISSLPDSATVSAIASAYAESAASSKLDESATADFYPTSNPSGFISSVDLSDYATTAYVDSSVSGKLDSTASSQFLTAVPAGYATTDYVDSSISGFAYNSAVSGWTAKQDALTFGYDTSDNISSINGSSIGGQGGGGTQVVTSLQYVVSEPSVECIVYMPAGASGSYMSSNLLALDDTAYGSDALYKNLSSLSSFDLFMSGFDINVFNQDRSARISALIVKASASGREPWYWSTSDTAFGGYLVSLQTGYAGYNFSGSARVSTFGLQQYGTSWPDGTPFYSQPPCIFFTTSEGSMYYYGTAMIGTAYGSATYTNTAVGGESSVSGVNELPLYVEKDTSVSAIAEAYAQSAVSSVSGNYYPRYSNPSGYARSSDVLMKSSVGSSDRFITSVNAAPLMATDSAITTSVSDTASVADGSYQTAFVDFGDGAVSRSVIVRLNSEATTRITAMDINGYNVEYGYINLSLDTSNYTYTGQYVLTSTAAVSAGVFVGYQGLSASAICGYTVPLAHASALPTYSYDSEDKISAINGSAIAGGGAAGVDSATCSAIASAYAESAVSSVSGNYYTTANESGFLTAQAQASWSESASASPSYIQDKPDLVDIVAGPGIVVDNPDGNTLRVSMAADYETVLWNSAVSGSAFRITLSEPPTNFERLEFIGYTNDGIKYPMYGYGYTDNFSATGVQQYFMRTTTYSHDKVMWFDIGSDGGVSGVAQYEHDIRTTNAYSQKNNFSITKVVGINRISGGN